MVQLKEQPTPADYQEIPGIYVWLCQGRAIFFVCWPLLMSSLSNWRVSMHTATDIMYWIFQRLTEWPSSEPLSTTNSDLPGLLQAILATQDRMGWLLTFFGGCIAVGCPGVQEGHFLWLG